MHLLVKDLCCHLDSGSLQDKNNQPIKVSYKDMYEKLATPPGGHVF